MILPQNISIYMKVFLELVVSFHIWIGKLNAELFLHDGNRGQNLPEGTKISTHYEKFKNLFASWQEG